METVLIALLLSCCVPIFHIGTIHLIRKPGSEIKAMFLCFLLYNGLWWLVSWIQNDFVILSPSAWIGGISTTVFMCLGYMEAFSLVCRGFSLRIMTDIYLNEILSEEEVIIRYGDGRGTDWMLQKRIDSIEKLKMVSPREKHLQLQSHIGDWIGWGGIRFKKILKMGRGG